MSLGKRIPIGFIGCHVGVNFSVMIIIVRQSGVNIAQRHLVFTSDFFYGCSHAQVEHDNIGHGQTRTSNTRSTATHARRQFNMLIHYYLHTMLLTLIDQVRALILTYPGLQFNAYRSLDDSCKAVL